MVQSLPGKTETITDLPQPENVTAAVWSAPKTTNQFSDEAHKSCRRLALVNEPVSVIHADRWLARMHHHWDCALDLLYLARKVRPGLAAHRMGRSGGSVTPRGKR